MSGRASSKGGRAFPGYTTMSGTEFEEYVKELLERRGWRVETTPPTRDGGIDLIAKRSVDMGTESTLYIQCKNYASPAGVEVVRQLNGVLPKHHPGSHGSSSTRADLLLMLAALPKIVGSLYGSGSISLS